MIRAGVILALMVVGVMGDCPNYRDETYNYIIPFCAAGVTAGLENFCCPDSLAATYANAWSELEQCEGFAPCACEPGLECKISTAVGTSESEQNNGVKFSCESASAAVNQQQDKFNMGLLNL